MKTGPYGGSGLPNEPKAIKTGMAHKHQMEKGPRPSNIKRIQPDKKVRAGKRSREY